MDGSKTLLILCLANILLSRPYVVWVYGMYAVEVGLSLDLAVHVAGFTAHLLMAVSVFLEDGGEEFQFLCKGILVTESFCSVYQEGED